MKLDTKGQDFIKVRERFMGRPYLDGGGVPTIAFGSTRYSDGRAVTMKDPMISLAAGTKLFMDTLVKYEDCVNESIKVPMTQNEYNAMVSLCYNIGTSAFENSTLVKLMNSNSDKESVANQFIRWNKDNGRIVKGLTVRRKLEQALFLES